MPSSVVLGFATEAKRGQPFLYGHAGKNLNLGHPPRAYEHVFDAKVPNT